jgi:putative inorganic carbon (hco3(-)) transporter
VAAYYLYLCFVASWFLHLGTRIPALGFIHFDLILVIAIAALAMVPRSSSGPSRPLSPTAWALIALTTYCLITIPFVEWPGSVVKHGLEVYVKAVVFYVFTVRLVTTERRLRWLLLVFVACQSFRFLEPLYLHVTTGYWGDKASVLAVEGGSEFMDRLSGAPGDIINPNGLAFVVLTVICFTHFSWTGNWLGRIGYLLLLPLGLYALVLTGSRSGLLTLGIVFVAIWLKSRRKVLLATVAIAAIFWATPRLSSDLTDRYRSVVDVNARNAETFNGRIEGVKRTFEVALRRPLFGHGLGTSRETDYHFLATAMPAHNLYAETAQELGFVGLGVFLVFLWVVARDLWKHQRRWRLASTKGTIVRAGDALKLFMVMNLVFSMASYGLTGYTWYFLAGLTDSLARLSDEGHQPEGAAYVSTAK